MRELGIPLGRFKPGKWNAITDVEGVLVGHSTIIRGAAGPLRHGRGPVRTGVTAILRRKWKVVATSPLLAYGPAFASHGSGRRTARSC